MYTQANTHTHTHTEDIMKQKKHVRKYNTKPNMTLYDFFFFYFKEFQNTLVYLIGQVGSNTLIELMAAFSKTRLPSSIFLILYNELFIQIFVLSCLLVQEAKKVIFRFFYSKLYLFIRATRNRKKQIFHTTYKCGHTFMLNCHDSIGDNPVFFFPSYQF